jgi:hypothetical protein
MNLFDIPIISIALAIIIAWALFAIFCSFVHEAIAQLKAERGRFMKYYLLKQLQDIPNGVNWASLLYLHGSVDLLSRAANKPTSDIEPHLFAESLIDVVGRTQLVKMNSEESLRAYKNFSLSNFKMATDVLKPSDVVSFFKQSLQSAEMASMTNGELNEGLVYQNLVARIEQWYVEFTQRLTLWYKKKTRQRLFILGAILGLVINVDSIELYKIFNSYPDSRQAVIHYYEKNSNALEQLANRKDSTTDLKTVQNQLKGYEQKIDSLNRAAQLPVGWQYSFARHPVQNWKLWIWKILGVVISGFAASFGAPFWFDVLRKAYTRKI